MFNGRVKKSRIVASVWCSALLLSLVSALPAHAESITLIQADEVDGGYERSFFKHWIDQDGDGCDTRREVLIAEAVTPPTIGARCSLSGGSWVSLYDGKKVTNSSLLDIDHLVPLAEAWRSGAWAWTPEQRTAFANDLSEPRALIAVTATTNRSKGDSDLKEWLPQFNRCDYVEAWVTVKLRYALTFDVGEVAVVKGFFNECKNLQMRNETLPGFSVTLKDQNARFASVTLEIARDTTPSPAVASLKSVRLYGLCQVAGSKGVTSTGERVTCKKIVSNSTLKWRR